MRIRPAVDEEALMEAYVAGDHAKFDVLFASLRRPLRSFFLRRFGDETVAEDLLQQTFLKLHRARDDYRPGSPLRPWVFTIAARVGLDERRRRGRRPEDLDEGRLSNATAALAMMHPAVTDHIERADLAAKVRAAVERLPASQRTVVELHRYHDMTFDEIAGELDSTEGAVKLRAFRAYARLRKQLAPIFAQQRRDAAIPRAIAPRAAAVRRGARAGAQLAA